MSGNEVETKIQLDFFTRDPPFLLKVFEINDALELVTTESLRNRRGVTLMSPPAVLSGPPVAPERRMAKVT